PKSRSKSVHFAKAHCKGFGFQLPGNGKICFFSEEILGVIYLAILCQSRVLIVQSGHAEHFPCPFRIGSGNDGGMDVKKAVLLKILMNRKCQGRTDPHYCAKSIGTYA